MQRSAPDATGTSGNILLSHLEQEASLLFTEQERRVIAIGFSAGEPAAILENGPTGRLARLRTLVFGCRIPNPLADSRLEALRAMAAAIRIAPVNPGDRIVAAFVDAGWSRDTIDTIRHMAHGRWSSPAGRVWRLARPRPSRSEPSPGKDRNVDRPGSQLGADMPPETADACTSGKPRNDGRHVCRRAPLRAA
jgi:hypothetical protein